MPKFMEEYSPKYIEEMKAEGASAAKISETMAEMETWKEIYKNPVYRVGMVFLEIFPVGLLVTLISAVVLRRKDDQLSNAKPVVA